MCHSQTVANKRCKDMKDTSLSRIILCLVLLISKGLHADEGDLEYKIKTAYLYNFTKFITWPEIKSPSFNICLLGTDPFGPVIHPIEKKSAFSLPIKVFRLPETGDLNINQVCQIVYLYKNNNSKLVFEKLKGTPQQLGTLVVGEGEDFTEEGGMIGFVNRDGKIRLKINLVPVKLTGLKISAKLLEVAEVIRE
jgi:YfiR/HmsC-like